MSEFADHFGLVEMLPVRTARLGRVARIYSGGTPDKSRLDFWEGGSVPWIGSGEVNQWDVEKPTALITAEAVRSSSTKLMPKGSLIMALAGQGKTKGMVARLAIAVYGNQSLACIAGYPGDERFLRWWLSGLYRDIRALSSQETRDGLNQSMLGRLPVPLFDLDTQKAIADFLDKETARIDQLVEKKQRLVELLGERRSAKTTQVLTGLTTFADERRKAGPEWMPLVPADWRWVRMKDICSRVIDCKNRTPPTIDHSDYFVVRTTCVRNGGFNPSGGYWTDRASYLEWTQRGKPIEGDVIFTREAPVGEACLAPTDRQFCLGQRTMIYRPDRSKVKPEFIIATIYSSIGRDYIQSKSKGSTVGHLRVGEVYDFPCLLPPLDKQDALLEEIRAASGDVDRMAALTQTSIDRLKEYRSALITAAVTGQIDLTRWGQTGEGDKRLDQIQEEMAG